MTVRRTKHAVLPSLLLVLSLAMGGCANWLGATASDAEACADARVQAEVEKAQLFREAETERAAQLLQEIERLQADLQKAEAALVEAESGLAGSHTRADAVSSLAVTRIQIERAEARAPWRTAEIEKARTKLREAERQVEENRFGAALFFVYRARRVAESILDEARFVRNNGNAQILRARRVNLRAGPSNGASILAVLEQGTPLFPQAEDGDWILVQVSGGPVGWVHRSLVDDRHPIRSDSPAAPRP